MRFVIVTGMSGAGKSTALKMLEDMGYFCVDNLPIPLLPRFVEMFSEPDEEVKKIALGIDIRGGQDFGGLKDVLDEMDVKEIEYEILFLDVLNLTVGQQTIAVSIQIPSSSRIFATGSYTVQCEVTSK